MEERVAAGVAARVGRGGVQAQDVVAQPGPVAEDRARVARREWARARGRGWARPGKTRSL